MAEADGPRVSPGPGPLAAAVRGQAMAAAVRLHQGGGVPRTGHTGTCAGYSPR
jgi:hypothetical protein